MIACPEVNALLADIDRQIIENKKFLEWLEREEAQG